MLTASQIDVLRSKSEQLLDPITNFLIEDIAKRVAEAGQLTSTAAYGVWTAQRLGMSQKKLKKALQEKLDISEKELESLLKQAAKTGYNFDLSRLPTTQGIPFAANSSILQIVAAAVKQAKKDLTNITRTMGFVGPDGVCRELTQAYNQACDFAFQKVSTGAQDYMSAIRDATRNLAEKGIRTIDYESGQNCSIEAATRRSVMGGLGLMQERISEQNFIDIGCDGWEISAHAASAEDHAPFQGRQYTDKEYKALNNSLVRRIGTLNCGHSAFPIILGVNAPQYTSEELEQMREDNETGVTYNGKHYTLYEASQRQRKLERTIRKQKRRILVDEATGDKELLQTHQIRLQVLKQEYARFSKKTGLPMQHARMETAGFTWKHGKAAEKVAKQEAGDIELGRIATQNKREEEKEKLRRLLDSSITIGKPYVELDDINSEEFGRKFSGLTQNSNVNNRIRSLARGNLTKNNGTYTETLDIIDLETGESVIHKRGVHNAIEVRLSENERSKVRNCNRRIIGMHNHPTNIVPTGSDFIAAAARGYDFGLVITHDLRVFRYTGPTIKTTAKAIDLVIDKHTRLVYTDDEKRQAFATAMKELEGRFGVTWREI